LIVVKVRDRDIKAAPMGPVTTGSVGLPVSWHFSEEWDDLAKTAVFRVGNDGTEITVAVLEDMCLVPDELLVQANAGENLWIGVYGWKGTNANDTIVPEIAMPTIWTYTRIQDGSQPSGIEPPEGTPGWSAQIQNATDEALRVAHGVAADAAAGEFDGISPAVTISSITHGHSVTITDRDHPTGQSFNVMDGDSAYEQAVAGGYTGTEAQFNEELASFKELSEQAADSAEAAAEVAPFYAVYGRTTKEEIAAAINDKRQIYAYQAGLTGPVIPYVGKINYADEHGGGTGYKFALTEGRYLKIFELMSSWNYRSVDLEAPAQRAEDAAGAAEGHASAAAGSAGDASRDAGTASDAASTATAKAGEADGSAKDAEAYAIGKRGGVDVTSADQTYHNNAKYYADQAGAAATTAQGHAANAANSATAAAGSATAAGNAQTAAETAQEAAETAQAATETAKADALAAIQQKGAETLASIPEDYTDLTEDVSDLKSAVKKKAPVIIDTASGAIASFEDGAADMPLKSLTVNIEPVQSGTGDPSPTNVRSISGWTGTTVTRTGKNLWKPLESQTVNGVTLTVDSDGGCSLTGAATANATFAMSVTIPAGTYYLAANNSAVVGSTVRMMLISTKGGADKQIYLSAANAGGIVTLDTEYNQVRIRVNTGSAFSNAKFYPQLELGTTQSPYEPYKSNTYSITFPDSAGTVYGGTLDVVNGVLKVTHEITTVSAKTWRYESNYTRFNAGFANIVVGKYGTRKVPFMCSAFQPIDDGRSLTNVPNNSIYGAGTSATVFIKTDTVSTVEDFISTYGNVQILYELAEPLVYDIADIHDVLTLLDTNNIWTDCGDVDVEYPADTKLYIQKINAPTDDDMIADARIESGKYFLIGNTLYLSTTTIPAGDTIIPGTNCTKTNLAAALNALNT